MALDTRPCRPHPECPPPPPHGRHTNCPQLRRGAWGQTLLQISGFAMGKREEREREAGLGGRRLRSEVESPESGLQPRGTLNCPKSQPHPLSFLSSSYLQFAKWSLIVYCMPRSRDTQGVRCGPTFRHSSPGLSLLICRMGHPCLPGWLHGAVLRVLGCC